MRISRSFYALISILSGLLFAQILSTILVYQSNTELFERTLAITQAGYTAVPNARVMPELKTFGTAFCGGIFFTLTVGACLTIFSFMSAWVWDRFFRRNEYLILPFLAVWVWLILLVNNFGLCRMVTAYFFLTPATVFGIAILLMPEPPENLHSKVMVHLMAFIVLGIVGHSRIDSDIFSDIRDNLLLSNPVGREVNEFYYTYTLHAARVFKSYHQRLIRTCSMALIDDPSMARKMESILLNHDYLVIERGGPTDLDIIRIGDRLEFKIKFWTIVETTPRQFLHSPGVVLGKFSSRSDRHAFLRSFTYFSLMIVPPILLYAGLYGLFRILGGLFLNNTRASVTAGILCCVMISAILFFTHSSDETFIETGDIPGLLASDNWKERLSALKVIQERRIEIADFPAYKPILYSPHIPERYWLARALGVSRSPATYTELIKLLEDPNFNVAYSAMAGLGQRGDRSVIHEILKQLNRSDNWYVQWYAYKTLRKLGWKNQSMWDSNPSSYPF